MIWQTNFFPLSGLQNRSAPPRGDFGATLFPPIANSLNGEAGGVRYRFGAAKGSKDVVNCVHDGTLSEKRIFRQEGNYPKCVSANEKQIRQNICMSDSVFDRDLIRRKMKEAGVTQADMARLLNLPSQSAMSNILKGTRGVSADEANIIYRYLGLNLALPDDLQHVPIIGFTSAGNWREAVEVPMGIMSIPPKKAGKRAFAVQVEGDSMDLVIEPGSYIVVDPDQKELVAGKCYLLQNGDHEVTVKCYQRDPARFDPLSSNPEHKGFLVSERDMAVLGRVVWKGGPM